MPLFGLVVFSAARRVGKCVSGWSSRSRASGFNPALFLLCASLALLRVVAQIRIIVGDIGHGNGVALSEVANGTEGSGSAGTCCRSYVSHRVTVVGMRRGPVGTISVNC